VKLFAPGLEDALAGSSIFVATPESEEELKQEIEKEISGILVESSGPGIILKADTLGSLEGITKLLDGADIPIKKASIGQVGKRDIVDANNAKSENKYYGVILAFNVPVMDEAKSEASKYHIPILEDDVIYTLLDNYNKWVDLEKEVERGEAFSSMVLPGKLRILPGCCFRAKSPMIVGVEVLGGRIRPGYSLMNVRGEEIGEVKSIQREKEAVQEAKEGDQLAISINTQLTFGRQVNEGDIFYTAIPKSHSKLLTTKYKEHLTASEMDLLQEIRRATGELFFGE
jgi:translation initiation factor 5B